MKNLTKKISAVLVIMMMFITGFATNVSAEANPTTDTATVTVSGLEPGASVTLYQIVQPKAGTSFSGYEFVSAAQSKLVGPNDLIQVTDASDNSLYVAAKDLDVDKDGKIDAEYTKNNVKYIVDDNKKNKILYNMEEPNQTSINLAVAESAYVTTSYAGTVANDSNYVQLDVKPGQYIGIITPGPGDNYSYNPVVLSVGYTNQQIYKVADTNAGETASHYKLKDGTFQDVQQFGPITVDNYHLLENCAWDSTKNNAVFAEKDQDTGVEKNDDYKLLYKTDGTTSENQLVAKNLQFLAYYTEYPTGSTAVPKRNKPGIVKNHETTSKDISSDENPIYVPVIATDNKGCEIVDENDKLKYIKASYGITLYNEAKAGKKFSKVGEEYIRDDNGPHSGTEVLEAMMTTIVKDAVTVKRENEKFEYTASQGEEIKYTLAPSVPQYPANAKNKTFVVTDNMSNGLDFVEGSIHIYFASAVNASQDPNATGSPNNEFTVSKTNDYVERVQDVSDKSLYHFYVYEDVGTFTDVVTDDGKYYKDNNVYKAIDADNYPTATDSRIYTKNEFAKAKEIAANTANNDNDFQVNFIYDNLPGAEGSKASPVIEYKAVLLDSAIEGVEGNPNVAKVYYANNTGAGKNWDTDDFKEPSGQEYNEWRDAKKVYTYEIRFRKTNDKPEYITTEESPTHYLLKDYSTLSAEQKQKVDALVKVDGTQLYLTEGTAPNQQNIAKTEALVKLDNGNEVMRYITTVDPVTDERAEGYNAEVYESLSKTLKLNPEFKTLKGAVFGLYTDQACENLVTTIEVGNDGVGFSTKVSNGDYWLKEITAPQNYSKNTTPVKVTPTWTSATTYTTETTERKVYTVDITKALNVDSDNNKPSVKTSEFNNIVADASIDPTTKLAEDQVGWLVGDENAKFYENNVYDLENEVWTYDESNHKMTHTKDGTVIEKVFRAYLEKETKTSNSGSATIYNNNGGTVSLNRINNTKTSELPSTGGIGTYLFTIAGVAIIATAAFMLIFRKKEGHTH